MFWYIPYWVGPAEDNAQQRHLQPEPPVGSVQGQIKLESGPNIQERRNEKEQSSQLFKELLVKDLEYKNLTNQRKVWSDSEDMALLEMRQKSMDWDQISVKIQNGTPQNCRRRFLRISKQLQKWPKEIDDQIIRLVEKERMTWEQINNQIEGYSVKKIRERYKNYLKPGIKRENWEIKDDLFLIELVEKEGRSWKKIAQKFTDRSELQVKNRYCRTIEPSIQKAKKMEHKILKKSKNKQKK